ncbi:MAG: hypothetical protein IPI42_06915 [Saprospiraceae bacterium]|nr:hypothetical protein [Candidatus Parvibacillus calidus]
MDEYFTKPYILVSQHNNLRIIALFLLRPNLAIRLLSSALKVCVGKIVQYYTIIDIKQFVCLD